MVDRWILLSAFNLLWNHMSYSLLKTSLYTHKRMRVKKTNNSLTLQKIVSPLSSPERVSCPSHTFEKYWCRESHGGEKQNAGLWVAECPGGRGEERWRLFGQDLSIMNLYTVVYTTHLVYIILQVLVFKQRLLQ